MYRADPRFRFKSIRDPLYGFVSLSEAETRVIDTAPFRRLQFVKQLSHSYLAYPSSTHTRFEHSLGASFVSGMMAEELGIDDPEDVGAVRMASLLHDVGHGPFSHTFEDFMKKINPGVEDPHEQVGRLIVGENPDLDRALGGMRQPVLDLLGQAQTREGAPRGSLLSDIVSGGIDADKLDYLRRDSYHAGVEYGRFDFARVLNTLDAPPDRRQVCISEKGIEALESYRLARYLMHSQVYTHHVRLVAEKMFLSALELAVIEGVIDAGMLRIRRRGGNGELLGYYGSLDDCTICEDIRRDPRAKMSRALIDRIRSRDLLKRAFEFFPSRLAGAADVKGSLMKMGEDGFDRCAREIEASLGLDPYDVLFIRSSVQNKLFHQGEILCRIGDDVFDVKSVSPISGTDVVKFLICGPGDRQALGKIVSRASDILGIDLSKAVRGRSVEL